MIYFVEGSPAVGKSFYARKLQKEIESIRTVIYYKEEYKNPIDLLRQAVLTEEEFDFFMRTLKDLCIDEFYKEIQQDIYDSITEANGLFFVPFMHIRTQTKEQHNHLYSLYNKEIDDGKCSYSFYCDIIIKRLMAFLQNIENDKDYIFEGALLHNPLFSILGFYDVDKCEIIRFYKSIEKVLRQTEYEIHLVECDDTENVIMHALETRGNQDYSWATGFDSWFAQTCKYKDYKGKNGIVSFSKDIEQCENYILKNVPLKKTIIKREV